MSLDRRALLGGLLGAAALPAWAGGPATSPRPQPRPASGTGGDAPAALADARLEELVTAARLGGEVSYLVARLGEGESLHERQADVPMPPASVAKVVTALYALEHLGPEHRFETRIMRSGPVRDGQLDGDLLLVGGADPHLDTDQLGDLVAALAATGLRRVTGRLVVVDGALPFRERLVRDQPDHVGYNPALGGMILNFNRVYLEWLPEGTGWRATLDARGERYTAPVDVVEARIEDRDGPVFAYGRRAGRDRWSVAASALSEPGSRWLPVRDPTAYAGAAFRALARAQGIDLPAAERQVEVPPGAMVIVAHQSDPLRDVLRSMLKFSTNLTAEVVGMTASRAADLGGSASAMTLWARGALAPGLDLRDHSGLNGESRVSARDMGMVIQRAGGMRHGALLEEMMREKAVGEAAGGGQNAGARILAKSGTMNYVSGLAGYVRGPQDQTLAFAIFAADLPRREAIPVAMRESPKGTGPWLGRARNLQNQLLAEWAGAYL